MSGVWVWGGESCGWDCEGDDEDEERVRGEAGGRSGGGREMVGEDDR